MLLARQIIISLGIAIFFPLLLNYSADSVFGPHHSIELVVPPPVSPGPNASEQERKTYDEQANRWMNEHQDLQRAFDRKLIVMDLVFGLGAILIGGILRPTGIGIGFIAGGIVTVAWNYAPVPFSYLEKIPDWERFLPPLLCLIALVFVGQYRQHLIKDALESVDSPARRDAHIDRVHAD